MKKILLLPFLLIPTLVYASSSFGSTHPESFYGFLLGILLGLILTLMLKANIFVKIFSFFPITVLSTLLTMFFSDQVIKYKIYSQMQEYRKYNPAYDQPEVIYPIQTAICSQNVEEVENLLSKPLNYSANEKLGNYLINCSANGMNNQILLSVMRHLNTEEHRSLKKTNPDMLGYCEVLDNFHKGYKLDSLRALMNEKLPIVCNDEKEFVYLNYYGNSYLTNEDEPKVYEWLKLLVESKNFEGNKNLYINDIVDVGSGRIILLALQLGDFYKAPNEYGYYKAPIEIWTTKMFMYCDTCRLNFLGMRLSKEDINAINKKVRPITADEINRSFIISDLIKFKDDPDTGAEFFDYLVKKGAKLNIAYYYQNSFLAEHEKLAPEFIAALNKLSKEQVEELAYPKIVRDRLITTQPATPLLESAKLKKNKELIEFLCSHNIKGC